MKTTAVRFIAGLSKMLNQLTIRNESIEKVNADKNTRRQLKISSRKTRRIGFSSGQWRAAIGMRRKAGVGERDRSKAKITVAHCQRGKKRGCRNCCPIPWMSRRAAI